MKFTEEFPNQPPEVSFIPAIQHKHVDSNGKVTSPILSSWTSDIAIDTLILTIYKEIIQNLPNAKQQVRRSSLKASMKKETATLNLFT